MVDIPDLEALAEAQILLAEKADQEEIFADISGINLVGGCSQVSCGSHSIRSAVVCLSFPLLEVVAISNAVAKAGMEYRPTFLHYRESPALLRALDLIEVPPDVLLVPATGTDHPRRMGMARHVGYIARTPTIGVTRTPLNLPPTRVDRARRFSPGPSRGTLYVSRGWGTDIVTAIEVVGLSMREHRLPEPMYLAKEAARASASHEQDQPIACN